MSPMLNVAVRAARAGGDVIVRYMDKVKDITRDRKGLNDFVTEVDRRAEEVIIDIIRRAYPQHGILAEESGAHGEHEFTWIIDPLDGTTNYLHGFPQFAVSIGLRRGATLENGVVYDPLRQELFTATRGAGAYMDNRRIRVSRLQHMQSALLGTGFPFRDMERADQFLELFRRMLPISEGIRRAGAAALDLAYVACGRLDGFWELGLKPWDIAAGALLITEAGGLISDMQGGNAFLESGDVVAANAQLHARLLELIREAGRA